MSFRLVKNSKPKELDVLLWHHQFIGINIIIFELSIHWLQ
jgi:hypothetical protein